MKISRRGASADYGESSIELGKPTFSWNKNESSLSIRQSRVKDFSTKSRHSYTVHLTLDELNEVLSTLADAAISNPSEFEKALEPSLKAILRIQAVAGGIKT